MRTFSRRRLHRIGLGILATLLSVQLVPYGRHHTNPTVTGEPRWDAPETRALAKQACFDCHSNETEWPEEAPEALLEGEMPPAAYTLVHPHARLSPGDRDRLAQGLTTTMGMARDREGHERRR
jgi:hypothetical protein